MKRTLSVIFAVALMFSLSLCLVFTACGKKNNESARYTITFNGNGGSEVASITAKAGEEITAPADPVKNGFEFSGWFESSDGGETLSEKAFIVNVMPARNVTLYAKWVAVSEVGKKYAVKDYRTDVTVTYDDPESATEDAETVKQAYSMMWLLFKENNAVEIFLAVGMPKDDGHFYAVNSENCVEFYETAEDAQNKTDKVTDDYLGWKYEFDSSRKTLTVTGRDDADGYALTIVFTAND